MNEAIERRDIPGYIRGNHQFHLALYRCGESPVTLPFIESLLLQTAPFMHLVLDRYGMQTLPDRHAQALDAIEHGNSDELCRAIELDIREGPGGIGQDELNQVYGAALEK